jgi:hypothetical protein
VNLIELVGHTYTKNWGLKTAENVQWLNADLVSLEFDIIKQKEDFLSVASSLIGIAFDCSLVPNSDAQYPPNCYINRGARRRDLEGTGTGTGTGTKASSSKF